MRPAVVAVGLVSMFAFGAACMLFVARGQGPTIQPEQAPPMQYIPPEERQRLARETDFKDRTQLSIELAEAHLVNAEQRTIAAQFHSASSELGIYQAIVEDAMRFLRKHGEPVGGKVPNKIRDLFKRLEMSLRKHGPRLETIRRTTPSEESVNVRAVYEFTRRARSEALNSFYGDTVLHEGTSQKEKDAGAEGSKGSSTPPPSPQ